MSNRSIGEVLEQLKADFPDISVSKIRFLESQGLVNPKRTASGYRQFDDDDLAQLRWILSQQRDHYLPLKVLRSRLKGGATPWLESPGGDDPPAVPAAAPPAATPAAPAGSAPVHTLAPEGPEHGGPGPLPAVPVFAAPAPGPDPDRTYTRSELAKAAGVAEPALAELESFGLLPERLDEQALRIAQLAGAFFAYGVEARHLRMYKSMAEREANFFEQVVQPVTARKTAGADATDALAQLASLGGALRETLLRQALGANGIG